MSDTLSVALGFFAALAPFGGVRVFLASMSTPATTAPGPAESAKTALFAGCTAFALLAAAALAADSFLDTIDVSGGAFLFAAGAAMAPVAARLILTGKSMATPAAAGKQRVQPWLAPVGAPLLAGPAPMVAAVAYAAHYGEVEAIAGAGIALTVTALILAVSPWVTRWLGGLGLGVLGRLSGGLLIAVAVSLAIRGVHNV